MARPSTRRSEVLGTGGLAAAVAVATLCSTAALSCSDSTIVEAPETGTSAAGTAGSAASGGAVGGTGGIASGGHGTGGTGAAAGAGGGAGVCSEAHPDRTLGLLRCTPASFGGYTLFSPMAYDTTYLIDVRGELVHQWQSDYQPGETAYLLDDGQLLRTAQVPSAAFPSIAHGGLVEEYDWDGNLLWAYRYCNAEHCQHHDIARLPNGNVLLVAWEKRTQAEAIAAGRDPDTVGAQGMWTDTLVEVTPTGPTTGDVVWAWRAWDHIMQSFDPALDHYVADPAQHPGRLDLNFPATLEGIDWLHVNSVAYHAALDQIVFASHRTGEIYVLSHHTATDHYGDPEAAITAAAGPEGELLYRWGNPQAYARGNATDQLLFGHHDPHWIPLGRPGEGHVLIFNNGLGRPGGEYSSLEEIVPPLEANGSYTLAASEPFGPISPVWHFQSSPATDFYSRAQGGSQRLPNGNTLVAETMTGRIFEVGESGELVWEYENPVDNNGPQPQGSILERNRVSRAARLSATEPALAGRDLTPSGPIELP